MDEVRKVVIKRYLFSDPLKGSLILWEAERGVPQQRIEWINQYLL